MINEILNKYINNEKSLHFPDYSLVGITNLLRHLGNPHLNFKTLHIAGTNGKGSTAFMLSAILEKSGYKTGLYTSPHLNKINERIKINSHDINDSLLYKYLKKINDIATQDHTISPTYFDILTAVAFTYFNDQAVDIAVIETGLGGRFDSTNVITPEISIITDISLDHINILGNNIEDISKEKSGIIKYNIPVITSNTFHESTNIIDLNAEKNNSKIYKYNVEFSAKDIRYVNDYFTFNYISKDYELPGIKLPLFPVHQVKNCAVVITALLYLRVNGFFNISDIIIYTELEKIVVPGRFLKLCNNPLIIYDPAHNFDALKNLLDGLTAFYPDKNKLFILSIMKDKADDKTIGLFKNSDVIYYQLDDERAYIPEDNKFKLKASNDNIIIDIIKKLNKDNIMIIFTGTFRIYNHSISIANHLKK